MFLCPIKYFTIYCFSKILQDNKYNIFIAEIDSNNIFIFFEKIYLNTKFHTPVNYYVTHHSTRVKKKVHFPNSALKTQIHWGVRTVYCRKSRSNVGFSVLFGVTPISNYSVQKLSIKLILN